MDGSHIPILLLIGFAIVAGSLGGRLFQRLRIPQVVGYIVIGAILGKSGFRFIGDSEILGLLPFNFFALGIIGFLIGGELHRNVFKRHGRQLVRILAGESLGAFFVVAPLVGAALYLFTRNLSLALSFGLMLGAISAATAPAATVDVLWEYKTRGMLTTTVLAIVALDDALALLLYSLAASITTFLIGMGDSSILGSLGHVVYELGGAVILGGLAGLVLNRLVHKTHDKGKNLTSIIGVLSIVIGLSRWLEVDVILAAMALGMMLINLAPHRSRDTFGIIEKFSPPIYTLFFVFVGARLSFTGMSGWMWGIAVIYVVGRTIGKIMGANLGARWAGATVAVRKYLGLCLFSQAGVAIGLAILASMRFADITVGGVSLGNAIIMIVTATTFLVQIVGPPAVKLAVTRAGECGLNVTEEDLLQSYIIGDVMDASAPAFPAHTRVADLFCRIPDSKAMSFCVTDDKQRVVGIVTMEELKQCLAEPSMNDWMMAFDLMRPAPDQLQAGTSLPDALQHMQETGLECLPVVSAGDPATYIGLIERQAVMRKVTQEVWRRRKVADTGLLV
ncbi:MAG: sodium:proton exchanger [Verrucomicrobia bacterium]|jgi:Kef-type K+ transport system membrane component KefB|nr:sodium:proton exchanger [Verrucomicrobiota bacterium]MBT7064745.1 sodium:proton exchanger [Verrucomicrobiota bacterium]MBT7699175.1 sodium:proton exchanger [Verrucomicrobiota bacterium]